MAFIGCTDAAHDWEEPKETFEENVLQVRPIQSWAGFDLKNPKFDFQVGDVIEISGKALAKNTVHMSRNHQAWAPIWEKACAPDEEFSGKATLTAADVSSIRGLNPPAIRVYGNTANGTFIVYQILVTRGDEEIYNLKEYLQTLKVGETDYQKIFDNVWIAEASDSGRQAVYTILGPGAGGEAAATIEKYAGKEDGVTIVGATIVDSDPSFTATGVTLKDKNTVVMKVGSSFNYLFPTTVFDKYEDVEVLKGKPPVKTAQYKDSNIGDYDYIELEYTISGVVTTSGGTGHFKTRFYQYDSTTVYEYAGGNWADLGGAGNYTGTTAYKLQTWGAGGKGGPADAESRRDRLPKNI